MTLNISGVKVHVLAPQLAIVELTICGLHANRLVKDSWCVLLFQENLILSSTRQFYLLGVHSQQAIKLSGKSPCLWTLVWLSNPCILTLSVTAKWEKLGTVFMKLDITSQGLHNHFLVMPPRV